MELNILDIVIHLINIVVTYIFLRWLLYKPISKFMRQRTERVEKAQADADAALAQAQQAKTSYDNMIAQANEQVQALLLEGNQRSNASAAEIIDAANEQASALLSLTLNKVQEEREASLTQLEQQIADMAVSLAGDILKREVRQADNQQVIDTFFHKVG